MQNHHAPPHHPGRPRPLVRRAAALSLALLAACGGGHDAPAARPNLLLVTLDTTRADRLGCYGYAAAHTPRLDALAADGVRFDRALSTAGLTPMSHASILTGRNPYAHGLRVFFGDLSHRLPADVPSLPELLGARGWDTGAFVSAYPVSQAFGLDRGYAAFSSSVDDVLDELTPDSKQRPEEFWVDGRASGTQRRADATTDAALAWLAARDAGRPWHLWVHVFDVHDVALVPPAEFAARRGVRYDPSVPSTHLPTLERLYDLELEFVDVQVGRLLDAVAARGETERTLVVVVGDHGQGLTDGFRRHQWANHRLLYDWDLRVPLIAKLPASADARAGLVVRDQVRTIDLLPTILELLDLPLPDGIEGTSLLPLVRGEDEAPRLAYADALNLQETQVHLGRLPASQRDDLYAVCDGRWKLIHHRAHPAASELYDLAADPLEARNLHAQHPDVVARLLGELEARDAFRLVPKDALTPAPDRDALGDLGYVGGNEDEGD